MGASMESKGISSQAEQGTGSALHMRRKAVHQDTQIVDIFYFSVPYSLNIPAFCKLCWIIILESLTSGLARWCCKGRLSFRILLTWSCSSPGIKIIKTETPGLLNWLRHDFFPPFPSDVNPSDFLPSFPVIR